MVSTRSILLRLARLVRDHVKKNRKSFTVTLLCEINMEINNVVDGSCLLCT
jgi:hypothetical protein